MCKKSILLGLLLCLSSAILTGCGKQQNTEPVISQTQESKPVVEEWVSIQETEKDDSFETGAASEQLQENLETEDSSDNQESKLFEEQMHKIWIVPEEPKDYYQNFSFAITKMENDYIEGQYCVRFKPVNPESERTVIFTGTINGKTAECQLWVDGKTAGTMTLSVNSKDKMKADICYEYDDYVLDDELIFEPYRVSDVVNYLMEEEAIATMEIEKWGKVKIVVGRKDSNKSSPIAVIVNEQNEILYEFDASYKSGTVIEEVNIADGNGDGLQDVEIVTYFLDNDGIDADMEPLRWPFYQDAEGTFYIGEGEVVQSLEPIF